MLQVSQVDYGRSYATTTCVYPPRHPQPQTHWYAHGLRLSVRSERTTTAVCLRQSPGTRWRTRCL
jgi:hypothetical protein